MPTYTVCFRRMSIDLINQFNSSEIRLVAVSKTKSVSQIKEVYDLGHRDFGENRVQELTEKQALLPKDIQWHMIGHLQKNKVKYIAEFVHMIHSVDSLKLARRINKEALKHDRIIDILLQIKIAVEDSKTGIALPQIDEDIELYKSLDNIRICGVMGIGSFTDDSAITRHEFTDLKNCFDKLKSDYFQEDDFFKEISMGMSGDYELAIEHGSTMVRIGSLIFGPRN